MRKVCQSDLGNTGKELFGEKFQKTLKSKADSMVAFGKIAERVEQNTRSKNQSFRGGPSTSRYAGQKPQVAPKPTPKPTPKPPSLQMEPTKEVLQSKSTPKGRSSETKTHQAVSTISPTTLSIPVGGRLANYTQQWSNLTKDPWILSTIQGFHISFSHAPPLRDAPPLLVRSYR